MLIIKKSGQPVAACCLGEGSELENRLLRAGKIRRLPDGRYEVFSRESGKGSGQLAQSGDYVKVDAGGWPYPNQREYFLSHHELCRGVYVQIPEPLTAWRIGERPCEALDFALKQGLLEIHEDDPANCFRARRWDADLTAPADAVLVFYRIERSESGQIQKLRFNFVVREEFENSYRILSADP